jgi:uncharacterized protein (DUF58 family)
MRSIALATRDILGDSTLNRRWYLPGVALVLLSIPLHQPLVLVVGVLLLLVVGLTDVWLTFCLQDVHYQRQLSERRVLFGEEITLAIVVENAKLLPLPWLEVDDAISSALHLKDQPTRHDLASSQVMLECLFSPSWYERITRRYTLQCRQRGVHALGPTRLRSGDIFGFRTREIALANTQYVLVYPLVVPLVRFGLPARHPFGDKRAPRRLLEDPTRVIGVRDYAYGDSLRRVHWKATARTMALQSKVYEATTTYTLVIFLNMSARMDAHYGIHPEIQELSVCAAASVAHWGIDEGYAVGLYANSIMHMPDEERTRRGGQEEQASGNEQERELEVQAMLRRRRVHIPVSGHEEQRKRIMEVLARVQPFFGSSIEELILSERTHLPAGSTIVVISSSVSELLIDTLTRLRQNGHVVTLLLVGESALALKLSGIPVYAIGGEATWNSLQAAYARTVAHPAQQGEHGIAISGFAL